MLAAAVAAGVLASLAVAAPPGKGSVTSPTVVPSATRAGMTNTLGALPQTSIRQTLSPGQCVFDRMAIESISCAESLIVEVDMAIDSPNIFASDLRANTSGPHCMEWTDPG